MHALSSQGEGTLSAHWRVSDLLSYCWPALNQKNPFYTFCEEVYFTLFGNVFFFFFCILKYPSFLKGSFACLFFFFHSALWIDILCSLLPGRFLWRNMLLALGRLSLMQGLFFLLQLSKSFFISDILILTYAATKLQFLLEFVVFLCLGIYSPFRFGKVLVVISSNEFYFFFLSPIIH